MNIYELAQYVNQDIDDTFSVEEIARWFNRAIASYNLIPPITRYPFITMDNDSTLDDEFNDNDTTTNLDGVGEDFDDEVGAYGNYPLSKTFMLAVMAPYIASAVKSQEASLTEKQLYMQEFMQNARQLKSISNIKKQYLLDQNNNDLDLYQLGENVYLQDFTTNPMAGEWTTGSAYKEVILHKKDNTLYKVVDDSKVDEDWDAIIDAQEG